MRVIKDIKTIDGVPYIKGMLFLIQTHEHPLDGELYKNERGDLFICHSNKWNEENSWPGEKIRRIIPVIVSEVEEVGDGDKFFHEKTSTIEESDHFEVYSFCAGYRCKSERWIYEKDKKNKIIVMPSEFPIKILDKIKNGEMKHGEEFLVECEEDTQTNDSWTFIKEPLTIISKKTDLEISKKFIKDAHIFGLVSALEGGVINLDELLVDFLKYHKKEKLEF